jgi:hypothetical protein
MVELIETAANVALVLGFIVASFTLVAHLRQGRGSRIGNLEVKIDKLNADLGNKIDGTNQNLDQKIGALSRQISSTEKKVMAIAHQQSTIASVVEASVPPEQKEIATKVLNFRVDSGT